MRVEYESYIHVQSIYTSTVSLHGKAYQLLQVDLHCSTFDLSVLFCFINCYFVYLIYIYYFSNQ